MPKKFKDKSRREPTTERTYEPNGHFPDLVDAILADFTAYECAEFLLTGDHVTRDQYAEHVTGLRDGTIDHGDYCKQVRRFIYQYETARIGE